MGSLLVLRQRERERDPEGFDVHQKGQMFQMLFWDHKALPLVDHEAMCPKALE